MREKGRSISPTGNGQVHEEKSSQIAASHPPIRGVESIPKAGVGIRKSPPKCPACTLCTNAPSNTQTARPTSKHVVHEHKKRTHQIFQNSPQEVHKNTWKTGKQSTGGLQKHMGKITLNPEYVQNFRCCMIIQSKRTFLLSQYASFCFLGRMCPADAKHACMHASVHANEILSNMTQKLKIRTHRGQCWISLAVDIATAKD